MTTARFVACSDEQDYARRAADPSVTLPLPVLLPPDAATRELRARLIDEWPAGTSPSFPAPAASCAMVIAIDPSTAPVGRLLANRLGAPLRAAAADAPGREAVRAAVRAASGPVVVVVLREHADDALLLGMLNDVRAALAGPCSWSELPRATLLTARDVASLSWVAAKACLPAEPRGTRRLVHLAPESERLERYELQLGPTDRGAVVRSSASGADVPVVLSQQADVLAIETHGSDACARGGAGAVLCGLHASGAGSRADLAGALACARGWPCPRGPRPVSLTDSQADVLLLTSCNGLRLADSNTQAEFNLGLAFLEGAGRAYVASTSSATATTATSVVFLAAMAVGRPLVEATVVLNAFAAWARIDRPTYLPVGPPDLRVLDHDRARRALHAVTFSGGDTVVDGRDAALVELMTRDTDVVASARDDNLVLTIADDQPDDAPSRFWFARAEGSPHAEQQARVFVCSFPEPLGRLRLQVRRLDSIMRAVHATNDAHAGWRELWRLCARPGDMDPDLVQALDDIVAESRIALARRVGSLRYDLAAAPAVDQLTRAIAAATATLRASLLEALLPQLASSFYLTNSLVSEYFFAGAVERACVNCGGLADRKRFEHGLTSDCRIVDVCPRCGIVCDASERERLDLRIHAPELVRRGSRARASVSVAGGDGEIQVGLRLSTHGHSDTPPDPVSVVVSSNGPPATFELHVPSSLPPHEYSFKALAASSTGLTFAHRLVWVQ